MAELAQRTMEAQAYVIRREPPRERLQHSFVIGPDRPDVQSLPAMYDVGLELDRIGTDGEARAALLPHRLAHHDARVERQRALGIDQQRVDVELGDLDINPLL